MTDAPAQRRTRAVAAVAIGGNVGDVERTFRGALSRLEQVPGVVVLRRSNWHRTAPVGGPPGQPEYLNGAVLLETTLGARELLEALQGIEAHFGRDRANEVPNGPRTLDLDLLLLGGETHAEPGLVVPHPRMIERTFVLEPLAEIAPERLLPGSGTTVAEALAALRSAPVRLEDPDAARAWCAAARARRQTIGFVPTMGALHAGHLALVRRAAAENDLAVVSIFVNPLQFNDPGDLERYPRDFEGDARLLAGADCAMVFTGELGRFFPEADPDTGEVPGSARVAPGPAAEGLEGQHRPGHFEGVATIVARLFDIVRPDRAYFGQKDFQQSLVVQDVARRHSAYAPELEVVVCPTVREPSGLARSSRNALLSDDARHEALAISRGLAAAREAWGSGERRPAALEAALRAELRSLEVEYAAVRDPEAWTPDTPTAPLERAVALVAANVGGVRLIDNLLLSAPDPSLP